MTTQQSSTAALSVGAILGDSDAENWAWKRSINAMSIWIQKAREGVRSPMRLNVVYHVDGRLSPNEFVGVRTGRFRRRDAHLMVQAAIPAGAAGDRRVVMLGLLRDGVGVAEIYARKRGIADDLSEIWQIVNRIPRQEELPADRRV